MKRRLLSSLLLGFTLLLGIGSLVGAERSNPVADGARAMSMVQGLTLKPGTGTALLVHPKNGKIRVQDDRLMDGEAVLAQLARHDRSEKVAGYSFSADGHLLAVGIRYDSVHGHESGTIRGYVRLYETDTGKLLWDSGAPVIGPVEHVSFSAKGDAVLYRCGKVVFVGGK